MKLYTKKGDGGETSLIGGVKVSKSNIRIHAYGTIDELNSYIGLLRSELGKTHTVETLAEIQDRLFTIGSLLASHPSSKMIVPDVTEKDIELLETQMDEMNTILPELKSFILPGGTPIESHCHVARCICRRAERWIVQLSLEEEIDPIIIKYINRLSDYLFVAARFANYLAGAKEIEWKPRV